MGFSSAALGHGTFLHRRNCKMNDQKNSRTEVDWKVYDAELIAGPAGVIVIFRVRVGLQ
jgi:hypothetical protein